MAFQNYVTTAEAAEIIGCTPQGVRKAVREGKLPGRRVGKKITLLPLSAVKKYAEAPQHMGRPRQGFRPE